MPKGNDRVLDQIAERCRAHGLRATPQRLEIMRVLQDNHDHPDVEWIFGQVRKRLPAISRNTVYRTLRQLERHGIVARLGVGSDHASFDAKVDGHHHFVCTMCGGVSDFESDQLLDFDAAGAVERHGQPLWMRIEVRGVCHACRRREATKEGQDIPGGMSEKARETPQKGIR